MEKRYIEELEQNELMSVFRANSKLQADVLDDMLETEMIYIGEKLDYIRNSLRNWEVGTGSRPYLKVGNAGEFVNGLIDMENSVPAFTDKEAAEVMTPLLALKEEYENADVYSDDFDDLEEKFIDAAQAAADALANRFAKDLDSQFDDHEQMRYFIEFYVDARMDDMETYYVKDDSYKLYKHVEYEKSFD